MAKKFRKKGKNALVPKGWDREILSLPPSLQAKVLDAVAAIRGGEPPESSWFKRNLSTRIRHEIAAELHNRNISLQDIATILGVTTRGAYEMMERLRQDAASRVEPGWFLRNLHDRYTELVKHASENKALAAQAEYDTDKAAFNRNAIAADGKAADVLLKAAENDLLREAIRQGGKAKDGGEKPEASDRESFIEWVFANKILPEQKQIEATEAEIIDVDQENTK